MKMKASSGSFRYLPTYLALAAGLGLGGIPAHTAQADPTAATPAAAEQRERAKSPHATAATDESARLVAAALEAQLSGQTDQRDDLLQQALQADPDCRLAHWLRGEVRFNGEWRTLEAIRELVADNPAYEEYLALRAEMTGTPAEHEELAHWCFKQGLENEERYHWAYVLLANPEHQFARGRLGVRLYRDGLYTNQQIEDIERQQASAEAIFAKRKPEFVALCRQAVREEGTARAAAFAALSNVADVREIPALEYAVQREARSTSDDESLELYLAVVESLSKSDDPQATHRLLDYAVYAVRPQVRQLAAQKLKPRPVTDYVPQLMGALAAPVEAEVVGFAAADGTVFVEEVYAQSGPLADYTAHRTQAQKVVQMGGARGPNGGPGPNTMRQSQNLRYSAVAQVAAARRNVAARNSQINARNLRVREVLANVFEGDLGPDPQAYWQAWTDFNELYVPDRETIKLADEINYQYIPTMSCFAAGTPIWTQAGPRPIEHIAVGDMVLSQDTATGELAFRPVMETTIRPPSKMVRIDAGGSPVDATLGHRFWINGKGWEMAKFLAPDAPLQSAAGSATVNAVEPLPPEQEAEAYNLVVHDFHTYFVGDAKLLVHDNSCPKPTASKVPGQATLRDVQPAAIAVHKETAAKRSAAN
jgi:hypothetical protein